MTNLIGTCLAKDKGREPRSSKEEDKGENKPKEYNTEAGTEEERGESDIVKEEEEEESCETSMTETAMGTRIQGRSRATHRKKTSRRKGKWRRRRKVMKKQ